MVSEAVIAEARRKALRNGEEDPVAVAQRYLNVYRQMHIFSQEKKDEFDQSLLALQPITISIISSLPGGLTFQDYIDEVLTKSGRAKSARENSEEVATETSDNPQILSNAQASLQPQPVVAPVMSGEAKLSMGKEFADEFAKIMTSIVAKQTIMQKDSLAKVAHDLGKTQLFIAKKLDDDRLERQAEISNLCKTIAQSHTALSTSLVTLGENIANQKQENAIVSIPSVERSAEDDIRLAEMIAQSQERMMSGLLARLPQAVGVGNVNVTAPSRSIDDDIRLADMIAQSQEKVLTRLLEKLPQANENTSSKSSGNIEEIVSLMAQSQEKLIATLAEKLPQMTTSSAPLETNSASRTPDDDERLIRLITSTQEKMINSLIEKNILVAQNYQLNPAPIYNAYQNTPADNNQYYYNAQTSDNNYSNAQLNNEYQNYIPNQNIENYNQNNVDFSMFTPVDEINEVSSIIYDNANTAEPYNQPIAENGFSSEEAYNQPLPETKKKKKKKKKKKNSNNETDGIDEDSPVKIDDDSLQFLDNIEENASEINFDNIVPDFNLTTDETNTNFDTDNQSEDIVLNSLANELGSDNEKIEDFDNINQTQEVDDIIQISEVDNNFSQIDNDYVKGEDTKDNNEEEQQITETEDIEKALLFDDDDIDMFEEVSDDNENDFDDKWLNFDEESSNISNSDEKWADEDTSLKADWDTDADSWGFESVDMVSENNNEAEYTENNDGMVSEDYEWEYVEDDNGDMSEDYEWEYVEDDGTYSEDGEWEYVEAIDDNAKIYSSDSYNQQAAPVANMFSNQKGNIQIVKAPQIYDEAKEGEIDDPYKNSILKD